MDIHQYFIYLLNRSDYSENKLRLKAKQKEFKPSEIDDEITKLKSYNYVNDLRLAQNLIRRFSKLKGKTVINQKLTLAGIGRQTREKAWELVELEIANEELIGAKSEYEPDYNRLKIKITKKFKIDNWQNLEFNTKMRVVRYLSYHGFQETNSIILIFQNLS